MRRMSGNRLASLRGRRDPSSSPAHGLDAGRRSGPLECTDCHLCLDGGRWRRLPTRPSGAAPALCPACRATRDGDPAHVLRVLGMPASEQAALLALVRRLAAAEARQHPLERLMFVRDGDGTVEIGTTGVHLARRLLAAILRPWRHGLTVHHGGDRSELVWQAVQGR